jgi:NADP-dependent 3-hydroxy acid dehydrogenase YdfG
MTTINLNPSLLASLEGKTAIVTGGANGIGAEIVRLFHSHGANVVVADLSFAQSAADALIASLSPKVVFIPTDILDWASMTSLFIQTKAKFGSIEIVVANAGIMESHMYYDFQDVDEEGNLREPKEWYKVLDVNLKGTMNSESNLLKSIITFSLRTDIDLISRQLFGLQCSTCSPTVHASLTHPVAQLFLSLRHRDISAGPVSSPTSHPNTE